MKYWYLVPIATLLGYAAGAYFKPAPALKSTQSENTKVEYRVRTVERIVTKPDGSTETTRTVDDNSVRQESSKKELIIAKKPDWIVGLGAGVRPTDWRPEYSLQISRRILGPVFLGAYGRTDTEIGLLLSLEF